MWKQEEWAGLSPCIAAPSIQGAGGEVRPCSAQQLWGERPPRDAAGSGAAKHPVMEDVGLGQEGEERITTPESSLPSSMQQGEGTEGTCTTPNPVLSPTTSPRPLATR